MLKTMMKIAAKKIIRNDTFNIVEEMLGCKWAVVIIGLIKDGVKRPGAMQKVVEGLTAKVLNERLSKMVQYGLLEKKSYPEIPPRVEYEFTDFGSRFIKVLEDLEDLQKYYDPEKNVKKMQVR
jgi:DNA-binding HxlR family transcriptional regulator